MFRRSREASQRLLLIMFLAGALWLIASCAGRVDNIAGIQVFFKLDPRLLGPTYGGERWVSPPTYGPILHPGTSYSVEARAQVLNAQGQPVQVIPDWIPEDPDMVTVSASSATTVTITVQSAGASGLQLTSNGVSKTLYIKAAYRDNVMQVEISQEE